MKTPNYINFDRYAIFNGEDRRTVMDASNEASDNGDRKLENSICGLYDGYLYKGLLEKAAEVISPETLSRLESLIVKIYKANEDRFSHNITDEN